MIYELSDVCRGLIITTKCDEYEVQYMNEDIMGYIYVMVLDK